MPAFFTVGLIKNDQVANGGTIGFGQNIVQNRAASKTNNASLNVGDGINNLPILFHLNGDTDLADQVALDLNNVAAPQI